MQSLQRQLIDAEPWLLFQNTQVLCPAFTVRDFSSRGPDPVFWPLWALHAHGVHTCRQSTHTHKIKINKP